MTQKKLNQSTPSVIRALLSLGIVGLSSPAYALEFEWGGQFWAENLSFDNYSLGGDANTTPDAARMNGSVPRGYYIPGGGSTNASWQTLFMRLRPKAVVNDNVVLKSEFWLGSPVFGMFGDSYPRTLEGRTANANTVRGASFTAQRFWAELLTDVGTLQVGRVPLQWGLGVVWNAGETIGSRYFSTGDSVRLVSKFGAFTFIPSFIKYSQGNNVAGACAAAGATCTISTGSGNVVDYSLVLKYENADEDVEGGVNFVRRIAGSAQDVGGAVGLDSTAVAGASLNTFSFYGRKKFKSLSLAAEVPITSGSVGSLDSKAFGGAGEVEYQVADRWSLELKAGYAPGQPNDEGTASSLRAFFFHPNYKPALILFNTQMASFFGPNTLNSASVSEGNLRSPFDHPVVNANYVSLGASFSPDRWTFAGRFIFASALESASNGKRFYNTWNRTFETNTSGLDQQKALGWEMDYSVALRWDDNFTFGLDFGWFFPGEFYQFSNTATPNTVSSLFASALRVGVSF